MNVPDLTFNECGDYLNWSQFLILFAFKEFVMAFVADVEGRSKLSISCEA